MKMLPGVNKTKKQKNNKKQTCPNLFLMQYVFKNY